MLLDDTPLVKKDVLPVSFAKLHAQHLPLSLNLNQGLMDQEEQQNMILI